MQWKVGEDFLLDLLALLSEEPNIAAIPLEYQKDFEEWLEDEKQQNWQGIMQRAWTVYNVEYIRYVIQRQIETKGDARCTTNGR